MTGIDLHAFFGCDKLTTVTIPNTVVSIGEMAFCQCTNLESVNFGGTIDQWRDIEFGKYCFDGTGSRTVYCTDGTFSNGIITYY